MIFEKAAQVISILIVLVIGWFIFWCLNHYPLNVIAVVSVIHLWLYSARLGPIPKREKRDGS